MSADAFRAAALVAADGPGVGGIALRSPAGPTRDAWLRLLRSLLPAGTPWIRMPPATAVDRLLGGLDPVATLRAGRPVLETGLLAGVHGGVLVIPMAERLEAGTAGVLAATLDAGRWVRERDGTADSGPARFAVVALDESEPGEDGPPAVLLERLGLHVELPVLPVRDLGTIAVPDGIGPPVREATDGPLGDAVPALCTAALALGIDSLRAPLFAARVARTNAALEGRSPTDEDLAVAARLVLGPRATRVPLPPDEQETARAEDRRGAPGADDPLEDRIVDAALAAVPPALLDALATRSATGGGRRGAERRSLGSGRSIGVRPGTPRDGARLAILETLRAAAPWQRLRGDSGALHFRPGDLRIRLRSRPAGVTIVFAVDASGSAAAYRLAEAKGAVELLLGESYVRRDQVALIAFRRDGAELVLAPTRALARARRLLSGLPGGGATPLAAGIDLARTVADQAMRAGGGAAIVLLTDGRANIARDGSPGRATAEADGLAAARLLLRPAIPFLVLDTARRPSDYLSRLAAAGGGRHVPLPVADPERVSSQVRTLAHSARTA